MSKLNLETRLALLESDRPAFFEDWLGEKNMRVRGMLSDGLDGARIKELVRYCWQTRWKSQVTIPEQIGSKMFSGEVGRGLEGRLGLETHVDVLRASIAGYGELDNEKMDHYTKEDSSKLRSAVSKVFFSGENGEENAKRVVRYAWDKRWSKEVKIPEAIDSRMVMRNVGRTPYTTLNVSVDVSHDLLRLCIENYGKFNDEKMAAFLLLKGRKRPSAGRAFYNGEHADRNVTFSINYAWKHVWSRTMTIPEQIQDLDIRGTLTDQVYEAAGIEGRAKQKLLAERIEGYGVFDDKKMQAYLDQDHSRALTNAFFRPLDESEKEQKRVRDNALKIVRYAWEKRWKGKEKSIVELVNQDDVFSLGAVVARRIGVREGRPQKLLEECFEGYGEFDEDKIKVFLKKKDKGPRATLYEAFFPPERRDDNLVKLFSYCWENIWQEELQMPEAIRLVYEIKEVAPGISGSNGINSQEMRSLLARAITDYGVLTEEKLEVLLEKRERYVEDKNNLGARSELVHKESMFFDEDNEHREQNARVYLEGYQVRTAKRISDLGKEDIDFLPSEVKRLLGIKEVGDLTRKPQPKKVAGHGDYNVVQIRWTPSLERRLKNLLDGVEQPAKFINDNGQVIWERFGLTSFAAHMKAQEMGLIPTTIEFGPFPSSRIPSYPLVEFEGYPFKAYALEVAGDLEQVEKMDAHLYLPIHRQNLHVNLPVLFRPDGKYSPKEERIIKTIALYLEDPNLFERDEAIVNGVSTIRKYTPPEGFKVTPRIVPVRVADRPLAQVFLPSRFSRDSGGVQTGVINTGQEEVYLFRHKETGRIIT